MRPEKLLKLQNEITDQKTDLAAAQEKRTAAEIRLTELQATRQTLTSRLQTAEQAHAAAVDAKVATVRLVLNKELTGAAATTAQTNAGNDLQAAIDELDTSCELLAAVDAEIAEQRTASTLAAEEIDIETARLWATVERVEIQAAIEQIQAPLARLQAVLSRSRGDKAGRAGLFNVVTRAVDTMGGHRKQAASQVDTDYLN